MTVLGKNVGPKLSRRQLCASGAAILTVTYASNAQGQEEDNATADFLFVQSADAMSYDAGTKQLTLKGVSPVTLFFSDRPDRIAGNMTTERFVPFWSQGKDSFLSDPPNADLSIFEDGTLHQTVVVLSDPVLVKNDIQYTVQIIEGEMPAFGENASLFIDVIGMPRTPLSVAGVDRRAFRRAAIY
jgi:hypothetical protein